MEKVKGKHSLKVGGPTKLTEVEERHFVDVLLPAGEFGNPLTAFDLRLLVKLYLNKAGKTISQFDANIYMLPQEYYFMLLFFIYFLMFF